VWRSVDRNPRYEAREEEPGDTNIRALAPKRGRSIIDLADRAGLEYLDLQTDDRGGFVQVAQRVLGGCGIGRIDKHSNTNGLGDHLMQEPEPLGRHLFGEKINSRRIAPGRARLATRPSWTRSPATPNTIGIVAVAALAARVAGQSPRQPERIHGDRPALAAEAAAPSLSRPASPAGRPAPRDHHQRDDAEQRGGHQVIGGL
jgi:hypothetical protein